MESILIEIKKNNIEKQILPSENRVIDHLLNRSIEMKSLYDELERKLTRPQQEILWDALLGAATFWNPESSRALREDKKKLQKLNSDIAKHATKLAQLIREREEICETTGISAYEDYDFLHWVHKAGEDNHLYQSYIQQGIQALSGRYDLKYWPEPYAVVEAIGQFANDAEVYENNSWTEELLSSPKHSMADYLRVIIKAIDDRKYHLPPENILPTDFRMSDNALATIINCTLNLEPEDMVSTEYIKRSRQNIRNSKKEN